MNALLIQLNLNSVVAVKIEFTLERQIRRDFQIARPSQKLVVKVDVVLLHRFAAIVEFLVFLVVF